MFNPNTIGLLPLAIYGSHNSLLLRPVAQAQAQSEHNLFIFIVLCRYTVFITDTICLTNLQVCLYVSYE